MGFKIGSPYHLYMMEQEGMLNTREGNLNAAIKEFKAYKQKGYDINDADLQERVLSKYKLNHKLTQRESQCIAREVGR